MCMCMCVCLCVCMYVYSRLGQFYFVGMFLYTPIHTHIILDPSLYSSIQHTTYNTYITLSFYTLLFYTPIPPIPSYTSLGVFEQYTRSITLFHTLANRNTAPSDVETYPQRSSDAPVKHYLLEVPYLYILSTHIKHTHTHTHIHIHTHTYTHTHIHTHTHTHIHYLLEVCVVPIYLTFLHICTHICTHIYVHTHTHTYIYIYVHTHT
jgi:hypothetical protein